MLSKIEVKNFRILKYVSQSLDAFQILVGANATGKTTLLDTVSLVSDIINKGIEEALTLRSSNFSDLTWANSGGDIEIALELTLPENIRQQLKENKHYDTIRYELKLGIYQPKMELGILGERALLINTDRFEENKKELFPELVPEKSVWNKKYANSAKHRAYKIILNKKPDGNDSFYPEQYAKNGSGWLPSFKLGFKKSALANLPADEEKFPALNWLKAYLNVGVQLLVLNSLKIREASRPGQGIQFKPDGSNLPWVIDNLLKEHKILFKDWLRHLQTGLPDIQNISIHEIPDNKHKYLKIHYQTGIEVPSWMVSDGTLRLLALTLIAYLPDFKGTYLIEEPENGIHPKALEAVFNSLSSIYDAQILLASHSSIFLSIAKLEHLLCFAKTQQGTADIVKGNEHPLLKNWQGEVNLSIFFAGGVL
jgi:predicted ATPase